MAGFGNRSSLTCFSADATSETASDRTISLRIREQAKLFPTVQQTVTLKLIDNSDNRNNVQGVFFNGYDYKLE